MFYVELFFGLRFSMGTHYYNLHSKSYKWEILIPRPLVCGFRSYFQLPDFAHYKYSGKKVYSAFGVRLNVKVHPKYDGKFSRPHYRPCSIGL